MGAMRVTVLGCAGSVGAPGVACSGYLIEVDDHPPVLLECGHGVFGELARYVNPSDVAVMLTHLHADHCVDLAALMVWRRWAPQGTADRAPLYGPPGTAARVGAASSEFPGQIDDISDTFDVLEFQNGVTVELNGLTITPVHLDHPPITFGLRIVGPDGQTLVFSGDTAYCPELIELADGADVFLCEASWTHDPDHRPPHLHMSGVEAGRAATEAGVHSLVLTHITPWTDSDDIHAEARGEFTGPLQLARPGAVIEVERAGLKRAGTAR